VLLECMCNLTANEMFDEDGCGAHCVDWIMDSIDSLAQQSSDLIVVTNDVASDGADYPAETQQYIRNLGRLNILLAHDFDVVIEMVCGIKLVLKGEDLLCGL